MVDPTHACRQKGHTSVSMYAKKVSSRLLSLINGDQPFTIKYAFLGSLFCCFFLETLDLVHDHFCNDLIHVFIFSRGKDVKLME